MRLFHRGSLPSGRARGAFSRGQEAQQPKRLYADRILMQNSGFAGTSIRAEIITQFQRVAQEQDKALAPLSDELALLDSGLDSLCLAIVVARLEDSLDVDPFSTAEDLSFPITVGEFIKFYEDAAAR
jgi:acyl carrier protein